MWKRCTYLVLLIETVALLQGSTAYGAFDPLTDPALIGWWKCDEGQGNVVADSGPGHHDGAFAVGNPAWTTGVSGSAISLSGDTVVEVPAMNLQLTQATMAGWVLPNGTQGDWAAFIMHRGPGPAHGFNLLGSRLLAYHWNDDAATYNYRGTAYYAADDWTHCAITIEPSKATFYVNGVAICTNTVSHAVATWDGPIWFGGDRTYTGSRHLNGALDEIMFFSRALTPAEVKAVVTPRPKARNPIPAKNAMGVSIALLQWTAGDGGLFHNVYLGTSPELDETNLVAARQPFNVYYHATGLQSGVTYYWRVDEINAAGNVTTGDVWSFTTEPVAAYNAKPADGSTNVFPGPTLSWSPGKLTAKHHVYFGSVQSEVADAAANTDQGEIVETTFSPGLLRSSTTYYWRVDEVKLDGSIEPGKVWNFTTADGVTQKIVRQWWTGISGGAVTDLTSNANYPTNPAGTELLDLFEGPTDWANNYGTRMYGWLTPPESGDYTFWIASDDYSQLWLSTDADPANAVQIANVPGWVNSRDFDNTGGGTGGASQKSAAIPLQAGRKYFIQALHVEGGGGDNLAVAWQGPGIATREVIKSQYVDTFALPPLQAYSPSPANGAADAPYDGSLSWSAGEKAQQHDVYFGDDKDAVAAADTASPLYKGRQAGTAFEAGDLEWGKTYFWRVDEINAGEADSPWVGNVWSFTTANYLSVDDMESYDDIDNRIYDTWLDNYGDDSGSVVGNDPAPFAERVIVHGGKQSLPMTYNNAGSQHLFSETVRTFDSLQNWTVNDVNALSLWVWGYPAVTPVDITETGGKMTVTGDGADIWGASDEFTFAYKTLNGDGTIIAHVVDVGTGSNTWAKGGVMIRDSLDGNSASAQMCLTGGAGNGGAFQNRATTGLDMNANDATSNTTVSTQINPPYWVKIQRQGDNISGFVSANGTAWVQVGLAQTIPMTAPVYIGICVTSHAAGENRTMQFDNISTTGGVSGAWQGAVIDSPQYNNAAPMYIVVEDSSGKTATASDAAMTMSADWTEWKIPLSSLTGVNLGKVKKLYLGVGDRNATTPGGSGRIFIDDIRVTRP